MLSSCCSDTVNAICSDEGTSYYECSKCKQPTDPLYGSLKNMCPNCENGCSGNCLRCNEENAVCPHGEKFRCDECLGIDNVNHPPHYTLGGIETTEYIKSRQSQERYNGHLQACVLEYVSRSTHKGNELEDLKKAQWYLNRLIREIENV